MIERVAEAIRNTNANTVGLKFTELSEAMARAAVAAMRDPTTAMCHAMSEGFPHYMSLDDAKLAWQNAIDEALR